VFKKECLSLVKTDIECLPLLMKGNKCLLLCWHDQNV